MQYSCFPIRVWERHHLKTQISIHTESKTGSILCHLHWGQIAATHWSTWRFKESGRLDFCPVNRSASVAKAKTFPSSIQASAWRRGLLRHYFPKVFTRTHDNDYVVLNKAAYYLIIRNYWLTTLNLSTVLPTNTVTILFLVIQGSFKSLHLI